MPDTSDPIRRFLRHTVSTIAYRGGKSARGAPKVFAEFKCGEGGRTPVQILAHIGDLLDWAASMARGEQAWHDSKPLAWEAEVARFHASLKKFDDFLASGEVLRVPAERLFQGPIADALTHVGQLAMLRRLAGCSMKSENYFTAEIEAGRVGREQASPKSEF